MKNYHYFWKIQIIFFRLFYFMEKKLNNALQISQHIIYNAPLIQTILKNSKRTQKNPQLIIDSHKPEKRFSGQGYFFEKDKKIEIICKEINLYFRRGHYELAYPREYAIQNYKDKVDKNEDL
eukprot:TRINITY_DN4414_c0_g1_i4.p4 TRINITY_DN4414_c0_g1~~TRINITY_DN4414_c0_g1_i4.p4  ORF type:complete len:122 (+),score=9.70 TRINITY_DN4414_c0_g1_i4:193-558(+)